MKATLQINGFQKKNLNLFRHGFISAVGRISKFNSIPLGMEK